MTPMQRLLRWFRVSQYAKPSLYFIIFVLVSGVGTYWLELGVNEQYASWWDGIWWSLITASTTGYGDIVPRTFGGRVMATLTILIGIGAASLLSGALASWLVDRNTKARRGLMEFRRLKDHLIICGWKRDMKDILLDIIRVAPDTTSEQIVVVSNVEPEQVESLKDVDALRGLKYVHGDYFSEVALTRAGVQNARKVLVLADTLESRDVSEVDSKTVMTVLTVKSLARDVYVTAEVLDKKYESYLKHAMCDEILFSRDFSRQMLASTSATNGMSHIIYDLISQETGSSRLTTVPVPDELINAPFAQLKERYANSRRLVLGILENTGSPNRMKMEALREAQKTSDVSQLVVNLQKVKGLEVNKPILLPDDEYQLQRHTLAIVLERL